MNIYQKLQKVRVELQQKSLKKTGYNPYSKYYYYELDDFLPAGNQSLDQHNLFALFQVLETEAVLECVNSETPSEKITFSIPVCEVPELKACHKVQGLGALITYLRRYLYIILFELTEPDVIDGTTGKQDDKQPSNQNKPDSQEPTLTQKTTSLLMSIADNDKEKMRDLFEHYTAWTDKSGKVIAGKRTMEGLSEKQIQIAYSKIKKDCANNLKYDDVMKKEEKE